MQDVTRAVQEAVNEEGWDSPLTQPEIFGGLDAFRISATGKQIVGQIENSGYMPKHGWMIAKVSTAEAAANTYFAPGNGTQAQVGAVNFYTMRRGNTVYIHAYNDINVNSLFYHIPEHLGIPGIPSGFGLPMGDMRQWFSWTIPVKK